jgi:phage-related minor tail protein
MAATESKIKLVLDGEDRGVAKAASSAGDAVRKMGAEVGKATDQMGRAGESGVGKFQGSLGKLKGAAAIGGAAIGGGLAVAFAKSMEFGSAQAKLEAQLGAGSAASQQAGAVAGKLYAGAYGESMADVGEAVKTVMQSGIAGIGATDDSVQGLTGNVMSLSQAFGQDLNGTVNAVGQMMRTGLAKNGQEALDILTVGFQQGNDKAGDLLDTFNEYGTQFRKVGLDGKTAMGLISQGLKAGARDADIVADSIKEFSIRAIDGSKQTADGFTRLGLSAKKMSDDVAAGGPRASAALQMTLDKLRAIKDPTERAQIAIELFGTQAEDMGQALYALNPATAAAAGGMTNVDGAAQKLNDTLGNTAQSKIESVKRKVEEWGASLVQVKGPIGDVGALVAAFGPQALEVVAPLGQMLVALKMQGAVGALAATKAEVAAVGTTAEVASVKGGKLAGALKMAGVALAVGAVAVAMDKINESSQGGNLSGWNGELHDLTRIMTGDWGNPLADVEAQMGATARNIQSGNSPVGKMFGWIHQQISGVSLTPVEFNVDTGPGRTQVRTLLDEVNKSSGTVNINGNDNPAGFALREILDEINAGKSTVTIDGQSIPAQDALHYVEGVISNGAGTVTINGQTVPAGQALADILGRTSRSSANINVGANTSAIPGEVRSAIAGLPSYAIRVNAVVSSHIGGATGGAVTGGRIIPGFDVGGPVHGPGTGTSDDVPAMLSNGEYVATARQVSNAGGPAAFGRLMAALDRGHVGGLAKGGPVEWGSVSASKWNELLAAGWRGRAGDHREALYRPAMSRHPSAPAAGGPHEVTVRFVGNTTDALATLIMRMFRTGQIQIKAA